jgi:hypothetical protein
MEHGVPTIAQMLAGFVALLVLIAIMKRSSSSPPLIRQPLPTLPEELISQVRSLIAQNKKIEAIKLVREQTNLGLKEAKDIVDGLKVQQP